MKVYHMQLRGMLVLVSQKPLEARVLATLMLARLHLFLKMKLKKRKKVVPSSLGARGVEARLRLVWLLRLLLLLSPLLGKRANCARYISFLLVCSFPSL
ncbi:hypothetical protein Hanom_Chr12g01162611 [Helianthus anomalus]